MCHACTISADRPNELYLGYFGGGGIILDISEPTRPRLISQLMMQPPFAGKLCGARCHTYLPLTGRNYAVLTNEGERFPFFTKEKIAASGKKVIVVTNTPYEEISIPGNAKAVVVTFATSPANIEVVAGTLYGKIIPEGVWPVSYHA